MSTTPRANAGDSHLERQLRSDLSMQDRMSYYPHGDPSVEWNPGELRQLEARIQATAKKLRPDAPHTAVDSARRQLKLQDLSTLLGRRAALPLETMGAPEPVRIKARWLYNQIFDIANELEPRKPQAAIDAAMNLDPLFSGEQTPDTDAARKRLQAVSRRMLRYATLPRPTPHQRVNSVLGDLRRLDVFGKRFRDASESRRRLAYGGNVRELRAALQAMKDPRELIERHLPEIYRDPDLALEAMRMDTDRHGLQSTIDRLSKNPEAFGRIRGFHIPLLGDSDARSEAKESLRWQARYASKVLARRQILQDALEDADSLRDLQVESRAVILTLPSRDTMLAELSRHMEGVPFHEIRPWPNQAGLLRDVRRADLRFLEPLREATRKFRALDASSASLGPQAQEIARLFQRAPRHVLRRLTSPQMQAVLIATSIAKRATKTVTKAATACTPWPLMVQEYSMAAESLRTVAQLADALPAFDEAAIRRLIFHAEEIGLSHAIVRIGRRVYVDVSDFEQWLDQRRSTSLR